ncbi:MAG: hypothetical protein ACT4QF_17555 [Sporichthyaceae bacterium]
MTYRDHVSTDTLADHAEGLLGESESGHVAAHLAECEDCRATALLLASIPEILAADTVGPMPAHFASRIDAAMAELYISEPPLARPEPVAATPIAVSPIGVEESGNVIDLGSRRRLALTGLRRVGTIAASMVLLIAGAALGIQTVGKDKDIVGPTGNGDSLAAAPEITSLASPYFGKLKPPKGSKAGRPGQTVSPDGTIYTKDKIRFPDGTVLTLDKKGNPVEALRPTAPKPAPAEPSEPNEPAAKEPAAKEPSRSEGNATAKKPSGGAPVVRPEDETSSKVQEVPDDPAAPGRSAEPEPSAPAEGKPSIASANQDNAVPSDDPYVSESNREYTEDNFAALVMDLISAARRHGSTSGDFEPSSTSPAPTPSATPPSPASQYRMPTSLRLAFGKWGFMPSDAGRGPSTESFQDRVKRCASQLGTQAIAGDRGLWQGREATIVVTGSDDPNQVNGFVFYGSCPDQRPVTAQSAQWEQRVNKPSRAPEPEATPVRRVGSVQDGQTRSRSY